MRITPVNEMIAAARKVESRMHSGMTTTAIRNSPALGRASAARTWGLPRTANVLAKNRLLGKLADAIYVGTEARDPSLVPFVLITRNRKDSARISASCGPSGPSAVPPSAAAPAEADHLTAGHQADADAMRDRLEVHRLRVLVVVVQEVNDRR
jgi:hypothetical protein